jgi:hypothetical protein
VHDTVVKNSLEQKLIPEKMHLALGNARQVSCSQSQTSSLYSNDFLLNSSRAIVTTSDIVRMEAYLELI